MMSSRNWFDKVDQFYNQHPLIFCFNMQVQESIMATTVSCHFTQCRLPAYAWSAHCLAQHGTHYNPSKMSTVSSFCFPSAMQSSTQPQQSHMGSVPSQPEAGSSFQEVPPFQPVLYSAHSFPPCSLDVSPDLSLPPLALQISIPTPPWKLTQPALGPPWPVPLPPQMNYGQFQMLSQPVSDLWLQLNQAPSLQHMGEWSVPSVGLRQAAQLIQVSGFLTVTFTAC